MTPGAAARYPFVDRHPSMPGSGLMPFLPVILTRGSHSVNVQGLLDTGASVNVLPYDIGLQLGADWHQQTVVVPLAGNFAATEARGLVVLATVGPFPAVKLGFAWARLNTIPLILGQTNFFEQFDICFFRSQAVFEVKPKP